MYNLYHGEVQEGKHVDEVLREYFPDFIYKGVFFDVGAYEPVNISNSYHFEKNGWETYLFEANTDRIEELKSQRKNVFNYAIADTNIDDIVFNVVYAGYGGGSGTGGLSAINLDPLYLQIFGSHHPTKQIKVHQRTLNTIIENEIKKDKIDILSIDVEGGELNVLKGLDLNKYSPQIICVENVFNNQDIYNYLLRRNYVLDKHIDYNQYYKLIRF